MVRDGEGIVTLGGQDDLRNCESDLVDKMISTLTMMVRDSEGIVRLGGQDDLPLLTVMVRDGEGVFSQTR